MTAPADATAARTTAGLEQVVDIETPEQVMVSYTIAGIGSRAAAVIVDSLIIGILITAIWAAVALTSPGGLGGAWLTAIAILLSLVVFWGYFVYFEGMHDGQTPGKKWMRLRVVQDGGYSVTFAASAVRNLLRLVDMQPGAAYAVGMLSSVLTRSGKRVGDLAAGTVVVRERAAPVVSTVIASDDAEDATAELSDEEYGLLDKWVARQANLDPVRRHALARQFAERFGDRMPQASEGVVRALELLHSRESAARARGAAAHGAKGAAREHHVLLARGRERWREFAALLAVIQGKGLSSLGERELSDFVSRYREIATDLARFRTAAGAEHDIVFHLSRLVAAGHNVLYRQQSTPVRSAVRFIAVAVPREIRASAAVISLAAAALFIPAITSYVAIVRRPALAYEIMPAGMIERAESAVAREKEGGGYLPSEETGPLPVMASGIATNNLQVTFQLFASGITVGIGTLLLLLYNGIMIGSAVGLFASKGVGHLIFAFVAPHGVLELFAICVAGGAALHIAAGILLPGALPRKEALVRRARRAIRLMAAVVILLLVAGSIEGFISPRVLPIGVKVAVSAATALLLTAYLWAGQRGTAYDPPGERFAYSDARPFSSR